MLWLTTLQCVMEYRMSLTKGYSISRLQRRAGGVSDLVGVSGVASRGNRTEMFRVSAP